MFLLVKILLFQYIKYNLLSIKNFSKTEMRPEKSCSILVVKEIGFSRTNVLFALSLHCHALEDDSPSSYFLPLHFHKNKFISEKV